MAIRYAHTNLVARDWRSLAAFYERVFGCVPVPPERDFFGEALERGTGVPRAHLQGMHLRLPGYGEGGPTLEVFGYSPLVEGGAGVVNRTGYGHIAFEVDDVADVREQVAAEGGGMLGEIVTMTVATGARVTWCYVRDPEGNVVELQSWS